jgi:hypothetical protein
VPSSWLTASARAVLPVPGPPASNTARPDIFFALTRSTTRPHALVLSVLLLDWGVHPMYLTSCGLAYKPACRGRRATIARQTQAFDMAVGCGSGFARVALDFADRDRGHFRGRRCPIGLLCDLAAPQFACKSVGAMMGQFVNARVGVFGCLELEVLGIQRFAKD